MRYRFYREHKFVSAALNDLERRIAKTDFSNVDEVVLAQQNFAALTQMLKHHAQYEDEKIHALLRAKNSHVQTHAERDHVEQQAHMDAIAEMFNDIAHENEREKKITKGYALYVTYRKFVADNLLHLHEEETILLPELQRLYSDEELRNVASNSYREMTSDDMVHMVEGLFPHMNAHDRSAFLTSMRALEPDKFSQAWPGIREILHEDEKHNLDES